MDADYRKITREIFAQKRSILVAELRDLSFSQLKGHDNDTTVSSLLRMSKTVEMWIGLARSSENNCGCFSEICVNLSAIMKEVAARLMVEDPVLPIFVMKVSDMLTMRIGQLTLDGHREEDEQALLFAQKVKEEHHRWSSESPPYDRRIGDLRSLWERMSRVSEAGPQCTFECLLANGNYY